MPETAVVVKEPKAAWDAYMKQYDYTPPESLYDWPAFLSTWLFTYSQNPIQKYDIPVEFRSRPFRGLYKAAIETLVVEATNMLQAALLARDEAAKRLGHRCFGSSNNSRGDFIVASVTVLQTGV